MCGKKGKSDKCSGQISPEMRRYTDEGIKRGQQAEGQREKAQKKRQRKI